VNQHGGACSPSQTKNIGKKSACVFSFQRVLYEGHFFCQNSPAYPLCQVNVTDQIIDLNRENISDSPVAACTSNDANIEECSSYIVSKEMGENPRHGVTGTAHYETPAGHVIFWGRLVDCPTQLDGISSCTVMSCNISSSSKSCSHAVAADD